MVGSPDHSRVKNNEPRILASAIAAQSLLEREMMIPQKISADLNHLLETATDHDLLDVNIFMREEPAELLGPIFAKRIPDEGGSPADETLDAVGQLVSATEAAQSDLLAFLNQQALLADFTDDGVSVMAAAPPESFWINNAIGTRVTPRTLRKILGREDVIFTDLSRHDPIEELTDAASTNKGKTKRSESKSAGIAATKPPKSKVASRRNPPRVAWSLSLINAPLCWQAKLTGRGILVAVVDTGVNYDHPDLKKRMWKGGAQYPKHGYDFENASIDPVDNNGHGTASAGQVAGDGTSGIRTGVAPEATILAIRVGGVERNFWNGLQFALTRKAHVINMSMTWKHPQNPDYPSWRRVCESIMAAGVLHANSTGNQGNNPVGYPIPFNIGAPGNCPPPWLHPVQNPRAGVSSAISVGATDSADRLAASSGRGPSAWNAAPYADYPHQAGNAKQLGLIKPDLCAPGPGTLSCSHLFPSQPGAAPYRPFGGTSAATPHVAGCLALLAQACINSRKRIVPAQIQEALEQTAKRVQGQAAAKENHFGAGRVDVYAAYLYGKGKGWWQ